MEVLWDTEVITSILVEKYPFCGTDTDGGLYIDEAQAIDLVCVGLFCVCCGMCGMSGPEMNSQKKAVECWNKLLRRAEGVSHE